MNNNLLLKNEMLKKFRTRKFFKCLLGSLGCILIIGAIFIGILWGNKIITLSSLKQINNNKSYPFYTLNYNGDYGFEDYLKVGSKDAGNYIKFILQKLKLDILNNKTSPNCSSFTATTPNGDRIFARNLDSHSAIPLFLRTKPSNGYKSISMVNLLYMNYKKGNKIQPYSKNSINLLGTPYFPLEGMNEHGLAVSLLTASGSENLINQSKITINEFSFIRMILDKSSTVEEAVKNIKNYNVKFFSSSNPHHFMIADALGKSVVVEYTNGEMQTVYSDKPYQIVTNFILYNNPNKVGFGADRYQRIEAKLAETKGVMTEEQAIKLLSENTIPGDEQWSAVYNLTHKKAYICVGKDYKTIYTFEIDK